MIRYAEENDLNKILNIWKETLKLDGRCLAIPFKDPLLKSISNREFFVFEENNEIVAFGGYKVLKKKNIVKIINICVKPEKRGNGLSKKILRAIYSKIKDLNLKKIVECQEGATNNTFWVKFGRQIAIKKCKTMNVKIILLDDFVLRRI
jgi:N-acetylglutamate synthase-like GNAT family acetyltransferase